MKTTEDWPYDFVIAKSNYSSISSQYIGAVSTSLTTAKWFGYIPQLSELNPRGFKNDPEPEYRPKYAKLLSKLDPFEIVNKAKQMVYERAVRRGYSDAQAGKIIPVLLCWCKPSEFCHRHLVADWISEGTGMYIPEVKQMGTKLIRVKEKKPCDHNHTQKSLF